MHSESISRLRENKNKQSGICVLEWNVSEQTSSFQTGHQGHLRKVRRINPLRYMKIGIENKKT